MSDATCPYCSSVLPKMPQRRTQCPQCKNPIHVKRPFGFPQGTKMLMTEQNVALEEEKWRRHAGMNQWKQLLACIDIDEEKFEYEYQRLKVNDDGAAAVEYLVNQLIKSVTDFQVLKMCYHILAQVARKQGRNPLNFIREAFRLELKMKKSHHIKQVMIRKPAAWPPSIVMNTLARQGMNKETISKLTGYSVPAVESVLEAKGKIPGTGAQCDPWMEKKIDIDLALQIMPLPCGPDCVCIYKSVMPD